MKKLLFVLSAILLIASLGICASADEKVVYLDGTLATAGDGTTPATAVKTFAAAVQAVKSGGRIVVCGDTPIPVVQVANSTGTITVTAKHGGVDYKASLLLNGRLVLSGAYTFENINIQNNSATEAIGIFARGYTLTMEDTVTCSTAGEAAALCYPILYGGKYNGAHTGDTHLIVKGGTWRTVYGGNYSNNVTGNSVIDFTGGTVLYAVVGGGYIGNFSGNTEINIGGDAVVEFNTLSSINAGVVGSSMGDGVAGASDTLYTHTGDIRINIFGNARIYSNVLGGAARADVTTKGDIAIDIYGTANLYRNVYGGGAYGNVVTDTDGITVTVREDAAFTNPSGGSGYVCAGAQQGTVTGNVKVLVKDNVSIPGNVCAGGNSGKVVGNATAELYGGEVKVNFTAGTRIGTVEGNTFTAAYGGRVGYHATGNFSLRGNGGYASASSYGKVTGTATVLLDGADVAGAATLGGANGTITLKSGSAGSVEGTAAIDLSGEGSLSLGGDVAASTLTGGGTLTLSSAGSLTAETCSGATALMIAGTPMANHVYVKVDDIAATGEVTYTATADEELVRSVGDAVTYTMTYPDRYETTKVRVTYYNPNGGEEQPSIVFYKVGETNTKLTDHTNGTENGKAYAEIELAPGLYYYKVYYNGASDYMLKYFYVSGKAESLSYDVPFEPYVENSHMEPYYSVATDEVLANFFGMDAFADYVPLDTPTFTELTEADRRFMSNAELCAYADALAEKCAYLYVYYPFAESVMGNRYPVLVFTKDTIPADATFDEVGEIVRGGGVREILMVSGGVHGNEPAGIEGTLAFANALTGEYGASVMESFGAIVIMPSVSADNFKRFKRNNPDGINPQRDLLQLTGEGTQNQVYVYKTFMPTVYIDCHEDNGGLKIDPADYSATYTAQNSLSHLDDAVIRYATVFNSPIIDVNGIADGTAPVSEQIGVAMQNSAIEALASQGLRSGPYYVPNAKPNTSWVYAQARGSYGFLIETMRIWTGKSRYERSVYSVMQALKALTNEVVLREGQLAQNVHAGREAAVITEYSAENVFAKKTTVSGDLKFTVNRPSIYMDGTYKDAALQTVMTHHDTVSDFIPMATAYVLPAETENIDTILSLLDMHGIAYKKLCAGATLTLRKYAGLDTVNSGSEAVSLGEAETVTFQNGAYIVTTDTSDSYLITYLFEPDSFPYTTAADHMHSLVNMGYLTASDALYRSETDDMVSVIRDMLASTVRGDVDGDGTLSLRDVLLALRMLLDGETVDADLDGDGVFTLVDVLRLLKTCTR